MRQRLVFRSLPLVALFLALAPTALASSTWYVDGVHGKNKNDCKSPQTACKTIGHAISLAHSGDSIKVAAANYKENLTIRFSLKIVGSGAKTTIIDGGGVNSVVTISNSSASVALSRLTIRNGRAQIGGGIYNDGMLTINNSTLIRNSASSGYAKGGGIFNNGRLTINDSTISSNTASGSGAAGGGIFNYKAAVTINNSTISSNTARGIFTSGYGGGILNYNAAAVTISNSTLSGNSTRHGRLVGVGGGLFNSGTATLQNTIVANNSGGNCDGAMTSNGYNLSSDYTCNFNSTGDLNSTDPKLGQLGNYGGPTQTIPLLSGSPAIDEGNPSGCTDGQGHLLKTDQRGKPRHDKEDTGGCDMGAYERQKD